MGVILATWRIKRDSAAKIQRSLAQPQPRCPVGWPIEHNPLERRRRRHHSYKDILVRP